LWISKTPVSDAGLANFAKHPTLRWIAADDTKLTDKAVATLTTLPALTTFSARKTTVSDDAIKLLKEKFPNGHFSH